MSLVSPIGLHTSGDDLGFLAGEVHAMLLGDFSRFTDAPHRGMLVKGGDRTNFGVVADGAIDDGGLCSVTLGGALFTSLLVGHSLVGTVSLLQVTSLSLPIALHVSASNASGLFFASS